MEHVALEPAALNNPEATNLYLLNVRGIVSEKLAMDELAIVGWPHPMSFRQRAVLQAIRTELKVRALRVGR